MKAEPIDPELARAVSLVCAYQTKAKARHDEELRDPGMATLYLAVLREEIAERMKQMVGMTAPKDEVRRVLRQVGHAVVHTLVEVTDAPDDVRDDAVWLTTAGLVALGEWPNDQLTPRITKDRLRRARIAVLGGNPSLPDERNVGARRVSLLDALALRGDRFVDHDGFAVLFRKHEGVPIAVKDVERIRAKLKKPNGSSSIALKDLRLALVDMICVARGIDDAKKRKNVYDAITAAMKAR